MIAASTRIRWRLARAVLWGGAFGVVLTVSSLVASSGLPWYRIVGPGGGLTATPARLLFTRDGWALVALAGVALAVGGLVQGAVHEWRLRRLVDGTGTAGGDDLRTARAAILRGLPIASAAASLASWTVGGVSLALLASAILDLPSSQAAELAGVCIAVGSMLAPFRYYRVRRELPAFWELLSLPEVGGASGASGAHAVVSLSTKLVLGIALPLVGLVWTVAAATAHRRDLASEAVSLSLIHI